MQLDAHGATEHAGRENPPPIGDSPPWESFWHGRSVIGLGGKVIGIACRAGLDLIPIDEGLARFDCTIYREVEAGDHVIVLLRLHAVEHPETGSPLIFHRSGFGRLAQAS
jgi:hypothetical protein